MSLATLLLVLKLITVAETEIPAAIGLVRQIKKAMATDPALADAMAKLNSESLEESQHAISLIDTWRKEHALA